MFTGGWNLPPGVSPSDVDGTSNEEVLFERFIDRCTELLAQISEALYEAEDSHPGWVDDPVYMMAIIEEEVGELLVAMREALKMAWAEDRHEFDLHLMMLQRELAQCGAVVVRALEALDTLRRGCRSCTR